MDPKAIPAGLHSQSASLGTESGFMDVHAGFTNHYLSH
jgi:hypothetical protein